MFWTLKLLHWCSLEEYKINIQPKSFKNVLAKMFTFLLVEIIVITGSSHCRLACTTKHLRNIYLHHSYPSPKTKRVDFPLTFFFEGSLKSWGRRKLQLLLTGKLISWCSTRGLKRRSWEFRLRACLRTPLLAVFRNTK